MATNNSGTTSLHNAEARGRKNLNQQQNYARSSRECGSKVKLAAVSLMEFAVVVYDPLARWMQSTKRQLIKHLHSFSVFTFWRKLNCFPCPLDPNGNSKQRKRDLIPTLRDVSRRCSPKRVKNGMEMLCVRVVWENLGRNQREIQSYIRSFSSSVLCGGGIFSPHSCDDECVF